MQISLFENTWNTVPTKSVGVGSVIKTIKSEKFKEQIELIRRLKKEENPQYKEEKKKLMAVTWSGIFSERLASKIEEYSGILCVDIDDIDAEQIVELKNKFKNDSYILGGFTSPSGDGLKVLLWSPDATEKYHQHFYFSAEKYFKDEYNVDIDRACKDVCRLCYVSYDDSAWIRESVESFQIDFKSRPESNFITNTYAGTHIGQDHQRCFKVAKSWVERIFLFEEGQRNKYIHNLACSLNRLGVPMDVCISIIENNYVTPDKKWHQSVGSAYKHNAHQFGTTPLTAFNPKNEDTTPYVEKPFKFGDVEKEIRRIVVRILEKNFPQDVVKSVVETYILVYRNFFDKDIINEYGIKSIVDAVISDATEELKDNELASATPIKTQSIADLGREMEEILNRVSEFTTGIEGLDDSVRGLMCRQNVIGFVGREKTFKSVSVHNMAYANAIKGTASLYCNGEMSAVQFVKRSVKIDSGIDFDHYLDSHEPVPKDVFNKAMASLEANTGKCMQVHSQTNFNKKGILDAIKKHRREGVDIKIVFIDGLSQAEDAKDDEIRSAIYNAGEMKQLAKEGDVLVIVLVHMRSGISKSIRDTGEFIRGGNKVTANFDAYFSTSLFEIPSADLDKKEPEYQKGIFHLLLNDKRGALDIVKKAVLVDNNLKLTVSDKEPSEYEL